MALCGAECHLLELAFADFAELQQIIPSVPERLRNMRVQVSIPVSNPRTSPPIIRAAERGGREWWARCRLHVGPSPNSD